MGKDKETVKKHLSGVILFCLALASLPLMFIVLIMNITGIAKLAQWAVDHQEE